MTLRPPRGIRFKRRSNGVGVTAYARWEAMVAPPPVENESDFLTRLSAITAALAGVALAAHIQWP